MTIFMASRITSVKDLTLGASKLWPAFTNLVNSSRCGVRAHSAFAVLKLCAKEDGRRRGSGGGGGRGGGGRGGGGGEVCRKSERRVRAS